MLSVSLNTFKTFLSKMSLSQLSNQLTCVFVYGTLKKGEPNHFLLEDSANGYSKFLFSAQTKSKYPLVIGPPYSIPYMIDLNSTGFNVRGEVYEVDDNMLEVLDGLEEHPVVYKRRKEDVIYKEGEVEKVFDNAWMYFYQQYTPELLKLPMLESYSNEKHHAPYVPLKMR
ncbi:putative gamma-glutamylcyclotransferase CG2811 [Nilaparvata lugens]|uniref:putative gamma-glutamylcyclotransferase CG2811 n=1 Tax=Nilaparvata lugens TaxID=108931 RepID=UPI00193D4EA8|nr:putative gamma-glutamylcyclotransferase CG2811 [Nilaparvata lugens]